MRHRTEPCWEGGVPELIGSHVGVVLAACLWIGILFVAGCGEENITRVIIDEPADTFFVRDTIYLPCTPHHFDPETRACDEEEEHEHEYDHDHEDDDDHHHGRGQGHDRHDHDDG